MKKLLVSLCVFFAVTSASFARVIVDSEVYGLGGGISFGYDCFDELEPGYCNFIGDGFSGLAARLAWEFKTDETELPLHFYAGVGMGITTYGVSTTGVFGMNHKLAEIKNWNLELDGSLEIGAALGFKGGVYNYTKLSVDAIFLKNTRRGFYGGAGLTFFDSPMLAFYKGYGVEMYFEPQITLHARMGIRI